MNLKGLDFFRKVHSDIESSSFTGGFFSILAFIVKLLNFSLESIYLFKKYSIFKMLKSIEAC